jgi:hypothetical protein
MERIFQQTWWHPGALSANHIIYFTAPFDLQLIHVSLVNTSANAGTLKIGKSTDDDAYLLAENFGVSGTPAVVDKWDEFDGVDAGSQFPHIPAGTVVLLTITDHGSHMAGAAVVLTYTKG